MLRYTFGLVPIELGLTFFGCKKRLENSLSSVSVVKEMESVSLIKCLTCLDLNFAINDLIRVIFIFCGYFYMQKISWHVKSLSSHCCFTNCYCEFSLFIF